MVLEERLWREQGALQYSKGNQQNTGAFSWHCQSSDPHRFIGTSASFWIMASRTVVRTGQDYSGTAFGNGAGSKPPSGRATVKEAP